ncbi:MAG TPA: EFR1 family ferrodoxin [Candidatus Anoxymicrobiaceae bacterium]
MSTEIYYFSDTGNSFYVARELAKRIPETRLTPIASLLSKDAVSADVDAVGFVFPTHGMISPIPVRRFLKKIDLGSANYLFSVVTRGGTKFLGFKKMDRILGKQGKRLDACFLLNMADNDPKFEVYDIPTAERIAGIESVVQGRLDSIARTITEKKASRERDTEFVHDSNYFLERLVILGMVYAEFNGVNDYFYCDEKCKGCGTCEKVCLSGKIEMADDKPLWRDDVKCYMCYACLNYCPAESVQIKDKWFMKSYTPKNGRYPHPYATAAEIAAQKTGGRPDK